MAARGFPVRFFLSLSLSSRRRDRERHPQTVGARAIVQRRSEKREGKNAELDMSPTAAKGHAGSGADPNDAAASPLPSEKWHALAKDVLRDAGGSLPSARKVRK